MARPLIGISGRRWPVSYLGDNVVKAMRDLTFDLHFSDYPRSVALAGGLPVELARDADVVDIVARLDGLVLSGGADINPERYGHEPDANLGSVEDERDEWELSLYSEARKRGIPVLAICRGFQLVNVASGGTLVQHVELDEGAGHPQWNVDGRSATHTDQVLSGTVTSKYLSEQLEVNSLHHQIVGALGNGLVPTAHASDGVIEGFESTDGKVLGVQWHPELLAAPDPTFRWLVEAASQSLT